MVVIATCNCDWLMECGVNVSLTLGVLYTLTGNPLVQAPRKAIILRATRATGADTHLSHAHAHVHTQLAQSKVLAVL